MTEDFEMKKAWLRRYQESQREEKFLMEEIHQLQRKKEDLVSEMHARGCESYQGELANANRRIEKSIYSLQNQIEHSQNIREEVLQLIESIDSPVCKELLRRRYILGQTWEEIADHMNMNIRWLTRLHSRCIQQMKREMTFPD